MWMKLAGIAQLQKPQCMKTERADIATRELLSRIAQTSSRCMRCMLPTAGKIPSVHECTDIVKCKTKGNVITLFQYADSTQIRLSKYDYQDA